MNRQMIYKFELNIGKTTLQLPTDRQILKVGFQNGNLHVWVLGSFEGQLEKTGFQVFPTGSDLPVHMEPYKFLESVFDGPFVWHIFEDRSK